MTRASDPLAFAAGPARAWFESSFEQPTPAQAKAWPAIAAGESVLLLAPTGSGKTLAAFLYAIQRLMFPAAEGDASRHDSSGATKVLYISPLKALGVDVERNLRAPLEGIRAAAGKAGVMFHLPSVGVRTGDTSPAERARLRRDPPEILITTPESLYLMLTSKAATTLAEVETVIVDEIHTMAASKRGAHLFLSLERLEALRTGQLALPAGAGARAGAVADERRPPPPTCRPLQRIGLSATQRPLEEIARLLGGGGVPAGEPDGRWTPRPVTVVDAGRRKALELTVEVPVEDMAAPAGQAPPAAVAGPGLRSIWPSIHPRLLQLIRSHRSTMLFVNSRRLAERLAATLNDLAGEEIAAAHHGSVAREARLTIEQRLKRGDLPALVATSSMELGIDMGAVDLVIQIEAPPTIASGLQRIGRAGHQVGAPSVGVIFPKYRGDLLACAAATARMLEGKVEETRYPRNPLDVLAQQIVAIVSGGEIAVDDLYGLVRGAAPWAELPRRSFEGVLDMLAGRYPSDRFAQLRPRLTWDRLAGVLHPRQGARSVAIINGGTIPDRGLYGVFLAGTEAGKPVRVGELDEEMVYEARAGEVFALGASTWRIEEITHERVLVTPAPGEIPKMPFWRGDRPGRPREFGQAIGALAGRLMGTDRDDALRLLADRHGLDEKAARNLLSYLDDQAAASAVPGDRSLVIERFVDEVGDWRVTVLSLFGGRVHAPWATAVTARIRDELGLEVDSMWSDDGIVFRLPESDGPPPDAWFLPAADGVEDQVVRHLADTPLFAARFRENAARALLLPRRRPGQRTPLWVQRRRSSDLLGVAADFRDFPIVLETYRDCLRDVFDLPGLVEILKDIESGRIAVRSLLSEAPSPFATSLMFSWVAAFMYEGDAPLAERRAQALALDHSRLRELLGEPELRELLDPEAIAAEAGRRARLDERRRLRHADDLHDLLLALGPLSREEIGERCPTAAEASAWIGGLLAAGRIVEAAIAGGTRLAAAEDAGLLRDALGVLPAPGLPAAFVGPVVRPLERLLAREARARGPFTASDVARRFGLGEGPVTSALERLAGEGRLLSGAFLPGGQGLEWCDQDVLRAIRQRSLARLRKQVEPVPVAALGRFLPAWHGLHAPARGIEAVLAAVTRLQGAPLVASDIESRILPARVRDYEPALLDELCASGEVVWRGLDPTAPSDGRIALYLRELFPLLAPPATEPAGDLDRQVRDLLARRGALFFADLTAATGAFPPDLLAALWRLVWAGQVSNDTVAPLRSLLRASGARRHGRRGVARARRAGPAGSDGRWSLLPSVSSAAAQDGEGPASPTPRSATERRAALARQLLERHGVLTKEAVRAEMIDGGFAAIYPVLKALEEAGRVRRGYFVAGLGATQFALPGAEDRLRLLAADRDGGDSLTRRMAATDPAQPWGAALPWPGRDLPRPQRTAGAEVILHDGDLVAWLGRGGDQLLTFLPESSPGREGAARAVVEALLQPLVAGERRAVLLRAVDGSPPADSALAPHLKAAGFIARARGWQKLAAR